MSERLRVLLVGATGLVGGQVIEAASAHRELEMHALARREVALPHASPAKVVIADPAAWQAEIAAIAPAAVICALGTTWRQAGRSPAAFRAVDHDLVLTVAEAAREAGAGSFVFVSSVGADSRSSALYPKVKGEGEEGLAGIGFRRLDILRPGLLRGPREGERRVLERFGIALSPLVDRLLHGSWRAYRSIHSRTVAQAALQLAGERSGGRFVHDNDSIRRAAQRLAIGDEV